MLGSSVVGDMQKQQEFSGASSPYQNDTYDDESEIFAVENDELSTLSEISTGSGVGSDLEDLNADLLERIRNFSIAIPRSVARPAALSVCDVKHALVIYNPFSGIQKGARAATKMETILRSFGINVTAIPTEYKGHGRDLIASCDLSGVDVVIAVGGDGSLHDCVNGMLLRKDESRRPIAVVPAGTGNSFAWEMMRSLLLTRAVECVRAGVCLDMDVLKVTFPLLPTEPPLFGFNSIHWGVGSRVVLTAEKLRWMGKAVRYTTAALWELLKGEKIRARLTIVDKDGNFRDYDEEFCMVIANNIRSAGKVAKALAPKALVNDGLVDLVIVRPASFVEMVKAFARMGTGTHVDLPGIEYCQARSFSITPYECRADAVTEEIIDIDGELKGSTPFVCEVLPSALRVVI
eukprot:Colp12_sorted_trinity150504_noHs@24313